MINKLENPMSYYDYKKRNKDVRNAINYTNVLEKVSNRILNKKVDRDNRMRRNKSCIRRNWNKKNTLNYLALNKKYKGINDTISLAKSELNTLMDNKGYNAKIMLHLKSERRRL